MNSDFYSINFYFQKKFNENERSYMKFQDLVSIIGDFTKNISIIGAISSKLFYSLLSNEEIYYQIFRFD